jgi:hypothetical protein
MNVRFFFFEKVCFKVIQCEDSRMLWSTILLKTKFSIEILNTLNLNNLL